MSSFRGFPSSKYLISNSHEYLRGEIYPRNLEKGVATPRFEKHPAPKLNNMIKRELIARAYSALSNMHPRKNPKEHPFIEEINSIVTHLTRSLNEEWVRSKA